MQLGNAVVQFEEKLSSAGRDSASYNAGALDAFRIAAITRCARVVHREPETGSIAAGYLFNDIARAHIDLFAKIPTTALDARTHGDGWPGNDPCRPRRRMRDRSFSQDDDYILVLAAQRPLNIAGRYFVRRSLPLRIFRSDSNNREVKR